MGLIIIFSNKPLIYNYKIQNATEIIFENFTAEEVIHLSNSEINILKSTLKNIKWKKILMKSDLAPQEYLIFKSKKRKDLVVGVAELDEQILFLVDEWWEIEIDN